MGLTSIKRWKKKTCSTSINRAYADHTKYVWVLTFKKTENVRECTHRTLTYYWRAIEGWQSYLEHRQVRQRTLAEARDVQERDLVSTLFVVALRERHRFAKISHAALFAYTSDPYRKYMFPCFDMISSAYGNPQRLVGRMLIYQWRYRVAERVFLPTTERSRNVISPALVAKLCECHRLSIASHTNAFIFRNGLESKNTRVISVLQNEQICFDTLFERVF